MTRREFMSELASRLARLPKDERESALAYYEEYFDEAGPDREQDVIRELKSPYAVASRILADHAIKEARRAPANPRKGLSALWFILAAIVAGPIALPIIAAAIGVIVAILSVALALALGAIGLVIGGIALFVGGFIGIFTSPASALLLFGAAFLLWGIGKIVFAVIGAALSLIGNAAAWLFGRPTGGRYGI